MPLPNVEAKYPHIVCNLTECKGNPFFAANRVAKALRIDGAGEVDALAFKTDVGPMDGSLSMEKVIETAKIWVTSV